MVHLSNKSNGKEMTIKSDAQEYPQSNIETREQILSCGCGGKSTNNPYNPMVANTAAGKIKNNTPSTLINSTKKVKRVKLYNATGVLAGELIIYPGHVIDLKKFLN